MAIASTVCDFLVAQDIDYHVFPHPYARSAFESAKLAHLPPGRVLKAVLLVLEKRNRRRYYLAVLPATYQIDITELSRVIRHRVALATEHEVSEIFPDCVTGAVPVVGEAYGITTFVDDSVGASFDDMFFEAGDHQELIRVSADQFKRMMAAAEFCSFSYMPQRVH